MSAISTVNPTTLFPSTTTTSYQSGILDASVSAPIPTNQWWVNTILQWNSDAIFSYPYDFKCQGTTTPAGLASGIPTFTNVSGKTVFGGFSSTFNVTMSESYAASPRTLMKYDDMGMKMRWINDSTHYFESYLYRGMVTISVYFNNVTPKIDTAGAVALTFDTGVTNISYIKFHTNQSPSQTWVIQTPANQSWTSATTTLTMNSAYTGWVFFTYIPTGLETNITNYVGAVVTGTSVSPTISGNFVTVSYSYTVSSQITGKNTPLIAMLTHHNNRITNTGLMDTNFNNAWPSLIRGPLYGLAATAAAFKIPLIATPTQYERAVPVGNLTTIQNQLNTDKSITITATEPYALGKELGKLSCLIGVANLISDSSSASTVTGNLKTGLTTALDSSGSYKLEYETVWGGVMAATDSFGARNYNDHHFHWGYWNYGAGVLALEDTSWFSTNNHQEKVNALARDIANPDPVADIYFPKFRNMDLYEFHSWAHGIVTEGDGKDQESESEALNAYLGVALWGQYSSNTVAKQAGQILLSMETEGIRNYYHYPSGTPILHLKTGPFKHRIPGILFMGKDDYATFFDGNYGPVNYIHCFPVTPGAVYHYYSDVAWASEHYAEVTDLIYCNRDINNGSSPLGNPYANSWYQFYLQEQALFQQNTVYSDITGNTLSNIDDGTTLTNILTYVATRPKRARPPGNLGRSLISRTLLAHNTAITRNLY